MSEVAEILKTVHDIFDNGEVSVVVDERKLGMAYAVPRGLETTAVETFGPWQRGEVRQVFFKPGLLGAPMAEVQFILSWRFSAARQYVVDAFMDKKIISIDPTAGLKITVRFNSPSMFESPLEAYEIPFAVEVIFNPLFGSSSALYRGVIRADGTSEFTEVI